MSDREVSSAMIVEPLSATPRRGVEWPTWCLIALIHGGWLGLTLLFNRLPLWIAGPAAAWLSAWHSSLQHELTHGHPTGNRRVDGWLGFPPLNLWLPFERYRDLHLAHHREESDLTDPVRDVESYYVTESAWRDSGPLARFATRIRNTLAGRVLLNPLWMIPEFLFLEGRAVLRGEPGARRVWALHALGTAAVLYWALAVCKVPLWAYLLFFVYAGTALSSIRSFAEHRAAAQPEHRTAVVERAPVFGLLFLFNNLHVVHHRAPGLAWYRIPAFYRENRAALLASNGNLVYRGYAEVARRYLFREHDTPINGWMPNVISQRGIE